MAGQKFTFELLGQILREAAGADDGMDLNGDVLDTGFEALGYDSLAILETGSRIEREYGITLDDDLLAEAHTPRELIDTVNARLAATV